MEDFKGRERRTACQAFFHVTTLHEHALDVGDVEGMFMEAPVREVLAGFEVFDEEGRPLSVENPPGRRALAGEEGAEEVLRFRALRTGEDGGPSSGPRRSSTSGERLASR